MSRAAAVLQLLNQSGYARLAVQDHVRIDIVAGDWHVRVRSPEGRLAVRADPDGSHPVDGTLACSAADLDRMLRREAPVDGVLLTTGSRDVAPRKRQAHLVLIAAALGWAGPWPDPAGGEHHDLVANALCDLAIGPRDRGFDAAGIPIRATDTAAGCTLLADTGIHAVRIDVGAREDVDAALQRLARIAAHVQRHGPPQGHAWFDDDCIGFEPDPAFPFGWTMPEARGGVWRAALMTRAR